MAPPPWPRDFPAPGARPPPRTGLYTAGLPNSLGVEGAGVVEEVGPNTVHPQVSRRVAG
jgi:threonine dehydrogenase-like Zn-dependent dehydrogenase